MPTRDVLGGATICCITSYTLASPHLRFLQEINALRESGARIVVVTDKHGEEVLPAGISVHYSPLWQRRREPLAIPPSSASRRSRRIAENLARNAVRGAASVLLGPEMSTAGRTRVLERIASEADLFWVIGHWSLEHAWSVARRYQIPVVYETIDLTPECKGNRDQDLAAEARMIPHIRGFITACDSYADYYEERYGHLRGFRRPVVHDNAPGVMLHQIRPTGGERRFLFFGSASSAHPCHEILEACALSTGRFILTFQGRLLDPTLRARAVQLGLDQKVKFLDPCECEPLAVVESVAAHDVGVAALRGTNENNRRASTSRLFTYMAAGLAVVGSDLPGIASVLTRHQNGVLVPESTPHAWAQAFDQLAEMSAGEIDDMKRRSLNAAADYTWELQKPRFLEEFRRAIRGTQ